MLNFYTRTTTPHIYTLSLHDALPISRTGNMKVVTTNLRPGYVRKNGAPYSGKTVVTEYYDVKDRKSTRLNSSHQIISYAVFCLKKKRISTTLNLSLSTLFK